MKKQVLSFVAIVILIAVVVVFNSQKQEITKAGFPTGKSLKELNDTMKANVVGMAQANYSSEDGSLFQLMAIVNLEYQYNNGLYVGYNAIGTASTQFGVMCPTNAFFTGYNFGTSRVEAKCGNFTRNGITTAGFDPQFGNFTIILGESAAVSNAMQVAFITDGLKLYAGHQAGDKFYTLNDGNYYAGIEKCLGNFSIGGGADFTHTIVGYADVKWSFNNNAITATANQLGGEGQNFVLSYVRRGIDLGKGVNLSLASAMWKQAEKSGCRLVAGVNKGRFTLYTEAGGIMNTNIFTPLWGLGFNCNM